MRATVLAAPECLRVAMTLQAAARAGGWSHVLTRGLSQAAVGCLGYLTGVMLVFTVACPHAAGASLAVVAVAVAAMCFLVPLDKRAFLIDFAADTRALDRQSPSAPVPPRPRRHLALGMGVLVLMFGVAIHTHVYMRLRLRPLPGDGAPIVRHVSTPHRTIAIESVGWPGLDRLLSPKAGLCLVVSSLQVAAFIIACALVPDTPPAWALPYLNALGVVMVAGRAKSVVERYRDVSVMDEGTVALAVRQASLAATFLGALGRAFVTAQSRGANFWWANRALGFFNSILLIGMLGALRYFESPAVYPPLDNSIVEGLFLASTLFVCTAVANQKNRRRIADAMSWKASADVGVCDLKG